MTVKADKKIEKKEMNGSRKSFTQRTEKNPSS